ncbi:MAG: hypothetical protein NVS2B7_23960 [Herpetosiphon sp.]
MRLRRLYRRKVATLFLGLESRLTSIGYQQRAREQLLSYTFEVAGTGAAV